MVSAVTRVGVVAGVIAAWLLLAAATAAADDFFPHPANAQWTYGWTDSQYNTAGTQETYTVASENDPSGCGWNLQWSATGSQVVSGSGSVTVVPDSGTMCFEDGNNGLTNTNWTSSSPPANAPILCPWTTDPQTGSPCANSLSSALFNVIWGGRQPVLSEPLLQGTSWTATGGAYNDVSSSSQYLGLKVIKVPAFPNGVTAAVVQSNIAASGDLGDPYGAGIRTTWWVYGVGPVRVDFHHTGGVDAPFTQVLLDSTNQRPLAARPDANYFPLNQGLTNTYKWTDKKHLPQPEIEKVSVAAVASRSARFTVQSVKGPIRVAGAYGFSDRLDGVTNLFAQTQAATVVKFPKLGHNKHFFTPFDLMEYGFNPLLPAYPVIGSSWKGVRSSADFAQFGVTGSTKVIGVRKIQVPAGTFLALEVQSTLVQRGHPYGSGVRTSWFAPGRGLVKLVFKHDDHSVSTVVLTK
jgi:hypothetical protein